MNQATHFRFVLIALLILLLFSYPMLSSANKPLMVAGVPLLYLYIGLVWLLAIVALYLTVFTTGRKNDE